MKRYLSLIPHYIDYLNVFLWLLNEYMSLFLPIFMYFSLSILLSFCFSLFVCISGCDVSFPFLRVQQVQCLSSVCLSVYRLSVSLSIGLSQSLFIGLYVYVSTICSRSNNPFYIVRHYLLDIQYICMSLCLFFIRPLNHRNIYNIVNIKLLGQNVR